MISKRTTYAQVYSTVALVNPLNSLQDSLGRTRNCLQRQQANFAKSGIPT